MMLRMFAEIDLEVLRALPFALMTVGENHRQKPISRPEGLPDHQVIWVREGSGHFRVGEKEWDLEAGQGLFMRAGAPQFYGEGEPHTAWITFSMSAGTLDYLGVGESLLFSVPSFLDREAEQLYRFAMGDSTPLSRSSAGYSLVTELFSTILSVSERLSVRVLRLLEQKYAEPLSLLDIAEEMHIDRFALCREYKQERGRTVMEDLNRIRIAKAKRFLRYGSDPVEVVGELCGFASPSYFGKRFREAVGMTPGEYRRKKR